MRLYLNEEQAAMDILSNKDLGYNHFQSLCLLAKHYLYTENMNAVQIEKELIDFIDKKTKIKYIPSKWNISISRAIAKAKKQPQVMIENVIITKSEMNKIQQLDTVHLQRVAFTLLCLAKYHNQVFDKNNNWTNCSLVELFKLSNVSNKKYYERLDLIRTLYQKGYIKYSQKNTNTNICVDFIDNNSDSEVFITDMRELGKQYMQYCGDRYIKCESCGKLFRPKTNNSKFCKDCRGYIKQSMKTLVCVDCGKEFEVSGDDKRTTRCEDCYKTYRSQRKLETQRERRKSKY